MIPIELSKQVLVTNISQQLYHLRFEWPLFTEFFYQSKKNVICPWKVNKWNGTSRVQTFSSVSSMASSLNFSLPPFLRMLSQKVASSSALELPATPLLQNISKASFRAYRCSKNYQLCRNNWWQQ